MLSVERIPRTETELRIPDKKGKITPLSLQQRKLRGAANIYWKCSWRTVENIHEIKYTHIHTHACIHTDVHIHTDTHSQKQKSECH